MGLLILSGMSGAGKSRAAGVLEDMGFFVTRNVPALLVPPWLESCRATMPDKFGYVLVHSTYPVMDVQEFVRVLGELRGGEACRVLFLDAETGTIIRRYKETRQRHPLWSGTGGLESAISLERGMLVPVRALADDVIDISGHPAGFLRKELERLYSPKKVGF